MHTSIVPWDDTKCILYCSAGGGGGGACSALRL